MYLSTRFRYFLAPDGDAAGADAAAIKAKADADAAEAARNGSADDHVGAIGAGFKISQGLAEATLDAPEKKEPEKKETPKPEDEIPAKLSHQHFQKTIDARKKAEADLAALRKELEGDRAKWEDERKKFTPVDDLKKQLQATAAERDRLDKDFKAAFAERQIRAEYGPKRDKAIERLGTIAQAIGDAAAVAAVKRWDYDKLAELAESSDLSPSQKRDWNRALEDVSRIDEEMGDKLKDTDAAFADYTKRFQDEQVGQQRTRIQAHITMAEGIYAKLTEAVPALKGAPDLAKTIRADLVALAGGEGNERFPAEAIMQTVAEHRIYERLVKQQAGSLEKLKKDLAERDETIKKLRGPRFDNDFVADERTEQDEEYVGALGGGVRVVAGA
jgi:hypothetical protein